MNPENELIKLADAFSGRTDHIQGAGGNISVKDGNSMLIKASGFRFSEMQSKSGYVKLNYAEIANYFQNTTISREIGESESLKLIASCIQAGQDKKPSMETGFHAVLGSVVVHTHSVYSNIINCMVGADDLRAEVSKAMNVSVAWLPYFSPGYDLSVAVAKLKNSSASAQIIFLKNHGIIVHGDTAEETLELLWNCDTVLKRVLNISNWNLDGNMEIVSELTKNYIFPDQAVYFSPEKTIEKDTLNQPALELIGAYNFIVSNIESMKRKVEFMEYKEVQYILNMEMEKYRKNTQNIL